MTTVVNAKGRIFGTAFAIMRLTLKLSTALILVVFSTCIAQAETGRFGNISSRVLCETGDAVIVTEFIVQGTGTETFLFRGLGPSLSDLGVPGALQDPTIRLLDSRGRLLDSNDDWMDNPDKDAIIATGLAPTDALESAMIDTLKPGAYTFVEQGTHRSMGVALPEVYDLFDGGLQLSAVGVRGFVGTDDNVIISGVIVTGTRPVPVLLRALGPSLADAGLTGVLQDPTLELYDATGTLVAVNDNWRDSQEEAIVATGLAPTNDLESALLVDVIPGAYTAILHGIGVTTGLGFMQFYSLALPARELNPAPPLKRTR